MRRVDDDPADTEFQHGAQFGVGLVVPMKDDPVEREPGGVRDVVLSASRDVEVRSFFSDESHPWPVLQRSAHGVDHRAAADPSSSTGTAAAQLVLVIHEQRGADTQPRVLRGRRPWSAAGTGDRSSGASLITALAVVRLTHLRRGHPQRGSPRAFTSPIRHWFFGETESGLRQRGVSSVLDAAVPVVNPGSGPRKVPRTHVVTRCGARSAARLRRPHPDTGRGSGAGRLALVAQRRKVGIEDGEAGHTGQRSAPPDRRDPGVRVLDVVHGVVHRLRGDHVEIEGLGARSMLCSRNVRRHTSGSASSRMSASVTMWPARVSDIRTSSPPFTSFTS